MTLCIISLNIYAIRLIIRGRLHERGNRNDIIVVPRISKTTINVFTYGDIIAAIEKRHLAAIL